MRVYDLNYLQERSLGGTSISDLAREYGVSRQRMYQIFQRHKLSTPDYAKKGYVTSLPEKQGWLRRMLIVRGFSGNALKELVSSIDLPETCPVFGITLEYDNRAGTRSDTSPSLDQIIAGGGYTKDNILVVSWRANRIKMDGTPEEHRKIYEYYTKISCN